MPSNLPPAAPMIPPTNAQVLAELKTAYYRLLTGNQRQTVRYKERETVYARSDLTLLRDEIRRLEIIVSVESGQSIRTVQANAPNPLGGFGRPYC